MRVRSIVILMLGMLIGLVAYCATDDMLPAQDKIPIVRYMIPEAFVSYTPLSNAGELSEESFNAQSSSDGSVCCEENQGRGERKRPQCTVVVVLGGCF